MPANDCLGLNQHQDTFPPGPKLRKGDPERPVEWQEAWPVARPSVDSQLLTQRKLDDGLLSSAPNERYRSSQNRAQKLDHNPSHPAHFDRDG